MPLHLLALAGSLAFLLVWIGMRPLVGALSRRAILDIPVERSSHSVPTPKGAGLLAVPAVVAVWTVFAMMATDATALAPVVFVGGAAGILMVVSWIDDIRHISPLLRLVVHGLCALAGSAALPGDALLFQGMLPEIADRAVLVLVWVWFINLFNFMDGIDGISATETLVIAAGTLAIATVADLPGSLLVLAAVLVGGALGFLPWNWHPAKIFLGDAGSAPFGYLLGWLLISLACNGFWAAALILPGYYLADSGLTLLKRLARGERIWNAHREHAYQKAAAALGHARTSLLVAAVGVLLIAVAVGLSVEMPLLALAVAVPLATGFFAAFRRLGSGGG